MATATIITLAFTRAPSYTDGMSVGPQPVSARILIVDDNATKRLKLRLAVQKLGHEPFEAADGREALTMLWAESFDVVLLDLQMPEVDGYQVLETLKNDDVLSDIPVVIISSLDDMGSISRAIGLGAEDYLDDNFPSEILNARISASIVKKNRRDTEREFLQRVDVMTAAAEKVNLGEYNPQAFSLSKVIDGDDSLANFARIFTGMSEQIFRREQRLNNQVRTLRNALLLFLTGAVFGLGMPLSRIVAEHESQPFGTALWVSVVAGVLGFIPTLVRRKVPSFSARLLVFLIAWGGITAGGFVIIFWVASHLSAAALSIIMVTEGFVVFVIAAMFGIEQPSRKRLFGLVLGFGGIILLIISQKDLDGAAHWGWLLVAMLVPLTYAGEDILLAAKMPEALDIISVVSLVSLISALILLPIVYITDDFVSITNNVGMFELAVLFLALKTLVGTALLVKLITTAGAVFGSQVGYVKAFAGIIWSMLLLGESLHWIAWVSFVVILVGLLLVDSGHKEQTAR